MKHKPDNPAEYMATAVKEGLTKCTVMFVIWAGIILIAFGVNEVIHTMKGEASIFYTPSHRESTTETTVDYEISSENVKPFLKTFVQSGRIIQTGIKECSVKKEKWNKTKVNFAKAYMVNHPSDKTKQNCLVLVYEVVWHNADEGDQTCYDAVCFDNLEKDLYGNISCKKKGHTITRSEEAWGNSFKDFDQCYVESVSALGGVATPVDIDEVGETEGTDA